MGMAAATESVYVQISRRAVEAREDGRAAYYARRGLESCPHTEQDRFYLACSWKDGWKEAEREAAGGWLAALDDAEVVAATGVLYRFGAGAPKHVH